MSKKKIIADADKQVSAEPVFYKADLVKSKRYALRQDMLNALLVDGKAYTLKEVDSIIETFLKKEVN